MSTAENNQIRQVWGGRFAEDTAASVEAFTASIHYDARLYKHDIAGSKAHARMLATAGVDHRGERALIVQGLDRDRGGDRSRGALSSGRSWKIFI